MFTQIKDIHVNTDHVSMLAVKESTLIIDFAYNKSDGPVFLTFEFESPEEAQAELLRLASIHNDAQDHE